ncbi:MAG: DUF898 family protein, partial [Gammaproteobacteria bacterium]
AGARAGPTPGMYLIIAVIYLIMLPILIAIGAFLQSSILNTTYNGTTLGRHGLQSNLRTWPLFRIYIGNLVLTVLTLGVYVPWARVRLARYRAESTALVVRGSLDDFVGIEAAAGAAVGEEIGDFFDVDFGF